MPLVTDTNIGPIQSLPETPDVSVDAPSTGEVFGAAFRQENTLVSLASNGFTINDYQAEEGYDPYDGDIDGYEMFAENFTESRSPTETANIKMMIDQELQDKQTLAAGGVMGFTAQIAAGITDPVYWPLLAIPGGAALKSSKTVGEAAARIAFIGGTSEIPAEAAKQYIQETRTAEESVMVIGGATVLSGFMGGTIKGLSVKEASNIAKKIDDVMGSDTPPMVAGNSREGNLSAAATEQLSITDLQPVSVGGLEGWGVSPLLRTENSPSVRTRQLAAEMMESATVKQANINGASAIPEGGAAETRIKLWDAGLYQGIKDLDQFYTAYRGGKGTTARIVNDYVMRNRAGKMTFREFREEVGKTMRRGDESHIPEVQQAAESFRKNVFDPLKDAAIKEKLLPPDVEVGTATSYLTRIYNTEKIAARRNEWDGVVTGWLKRGRKSARMTDKPTAQQKLEAALTDVEIKAIADDITENILGTSSGRVPYEVVPITRGPLKERTFNIPDSLIEDFLQSDIDLVSRQYKRTMAADVELTRLYGTADMKMQLEELSESYADLIKGAKTEKERLALQSKKERDITDIQAMRDRLRGNYLTPADPNTFFIRAGRVMRDVNFLRMLGGMTLSAIPDLARPIAVNGLKPVSKGLMAMATSPKRFGMALKEARKNAIGLDMVLNSRAASLAEITDIYNKGTSFERGLRSMSDAFGKISLMTQWNAALKQFAGVVTQDRIIDACVQWADGTLSKSQIKRLAASGIDEDAAKSIARQFRQFGDDGELKLSNGHLWDDRDTLETFRAAVLKDVDRTILTPGEGEKPLWTSTETGKMVFQFKTFAATAHNKILVADLQYRDAEALNGFLLATALGGATYGLKQYVAGRDISTDPEKLIIESLDRSGAFGYFWDVNNITEKMTRGQVGVNRLIGAPPMSRYASRNVLGAIMGPSLGTVEDVATVTGAISQGEFTESEKRKIRKLLPGQNLFYIRRLLNELEEKI